MVYPPIIKIPTFREWLKEKYDGDMVSVNKSLNEEIRYGLEKIKNKPEPKSIGLYNYKMDCNSCLWMPYTVCNAGLKNKVMAKPIEDEIDAPMGSYCTAYRAREINPTLKNRILDLAASILMNIEHRFNMAALKIWDKRNKKVFYNNAID